MGLAFPPTPSFILLSISFPPSSASGKAAPERNSLMGILPLYSSLSFGSVPLCSALCPGMLASVGYPTGEHGQQTRRRE